jgi:hypothetical protein
MGNDSNKRKKLVVGLSITGTNDKILIELKEIILFNV